MEWDWILQKRWRVFFFFALSDLMVERQMTNFLFFGQGPKKNHLSDCCLSTHRPHVFSPSSIARCSQRAPPPSPVFKITFGSWKKLQATQKGQNTESQSLLNSWGATRWAFCQCDASSSSFGKSTDVVSTKNCPFCLQYFVLYTFLQHIHRCLLTATRALTHASTSF